MIRLEPYRAEMRDQVLALLGNKPHKKLIWDWQYHGRPLGPSVEPLVALDDGRIVGFNGVMAVDVFYTGSVIQAVWSCDFFVDPAYRGQGVGQQMKQRLIAESPLILSLGISHMASPLLVKMGWRVTTDIHVYAMILKCTSGADQLRVVAQQLNRMRFRLRKAGHADIRLASSLPTPQKIDTLWRRVGPSYGKAVSRTSNYMHWRYEGHPTAQYRFLHMEVDSELCGVAVLREAGTTLRFVDYLGPLDCPWMLRNLIASMGRLFPDAHCHVCTASHRALQIALLGSGFLRTRKQIRFYVRSTTAKDPNPVAGWFIMDGDSDGEILDAARAGPLHIGQNSNPTQESGVT